MAVYKNIKDVPVGIDGPSGIRCFLCKQESPDRRLPAIIKRANENVRWRVRSYHQYSGDVVSQSVHENHQVTQCQSTSPKLNDLLGVNESDTSESTSVGTQTTQRDVLLAHYIPVYVMLPLNVISNDNMINNVELLHANLRALKAAHVDGLMVDVWWGIVERGGPREYDWSAYQSLFQIIQGYQFKLQAVLSFHQCGGNVGDNCCIRLPGWILEQGGSNPDIFFTNRNGKRNAEYLSFGIDDKPVLQGRTAVEVYTDFMRSFRENMHGYLEAEMLTELEVGLGPSGELRYPSFSESHGWRFPGIGEFQCYDKYLLSDFQKVAENVGHKEWGNSGPQDAGSYNDWPQSTGFFRHHGTFTSDYGRFFLEWYSNVLLQHGDKILEAASNVFAGYKIKLAAKIAGIHWWYNSRNHAAELAAGYYNLRERDGYRPIAKMLARHNAILNFTCIEMRDDEHYWEARCGPEGLVRQVLNAGWNEGIEVSCENALPRYDRAAFQQILKNVRPGGISKENAPWKRVHSFTYLRLCQDLMQENHWREFNQFVRCMHASLDYHPEPEMYFHPRGPLERSKPFEESQMDESAVPIASVPLDQNHVPLALKEIESSFSEDAPGGGLGVVQGDDASVPFPLNLVKWLWRRLGSPHVKNTHVQQQDENATQQDDDFPGYLL